MSDDKMLTPTEQLAALLEESGAEAIFRHCDVKAVFQSQAARIAELEGEVWNSQQMTPMLHKRIAELERALSERREMSKAAQIAFDGIQRRLVEEREKREKAQACLSLQRKAWSGVSKIELDGPLVDFADAQIKRIDAALATSEVID